jgi:hypothetical protein
VTPQINKCKDCGSDYVKLPLLLDTENDEKEGEMTEIREGRKPGVFVNPRVLPTCIDF